jgi:hypothetical protein
MWSFQNRFLYYSFFQFEIIFSYFVILEACANAAELFVINMVKSRIGPLFTITTFGLVKAYFHDVSKNIVFCDLCLCTALYDVLKTRSV